MHCIQTMFGPMLIWSLDRIFTFIVLIIYIFLIRTYKKKPTKIGGEKAFVDNDDNN